MTARRNNPGEGFQRRTSDMRRIVVSFDEDTFSEIRGLAVKRGVSIAAVVRELVEFGLIDTEAAS